MKGHLIFVGEWFYNVIIHIQVSSNLNLDAYFF
jgi:hypothetical protein